MDFKSLTKDGTYRVTHNGLKGLLFFSPANDCWFFEVPGKSLTEVSQADIANMKKRA